MSKKKLNHIKIKIIQNAPEKDLKQLYEQAGWWESPPVGETDFLKQVVENCTLFAGAFDEKKMIGMGRALSDGVSDAYIQDVTVLKPYRGKGIGQGIIQMLIKELKQKGVDWIGLIAEPGTSTFYENLGFTPMTGHIPLKYKGQ
jgi:spermidine synthase